MLGLFSIEITEIMIASTPRIGLQRSSALSWELRGSVPGGCRIEMQTLPFSKTKTKVTQLENWLTVWVPHFCDEPHLWRVVWVVVREFELRLEESTLKKAGKWFAQKFVCCKLNFTYLVKRIRRSCENHVPQEEIIVVFKPDRSAEVPTCRDV